MNSDTETLDNIAKLKKIQSELGMLLPDMFECLKPILGLRLSEFQSHHEYFSFFDQQCLLRNIDTDELESNWMRAYGGDSRYAKMLYQGACHELIKSRKAMNHDPVDDSSIDEFSVNMQLMIRAIRELIATGILSPKEAEIRQARAGGVGRMRSFEPAKKKLLELLASNAPASGWSTKSEALKAIDTPLGQFIETNKIGLKLDALISTAAGWARNDPEIAAAFERFVNRKPKMRSGRTERPERE